ncbi:Ig-like domain-containing protein [Streptomyces malaysiensis]|nr:Ig-like domain-containing protein [Streptomyces malaysiensis]
MDPADARPARITITPGSDTAAIAPDATVKVTASHGTLTKVRVVPDGAGSQAVTVTGALSRSKSSWHSTRTMTPGATYTVEATATNAAGKSAVQHSAFRTRTAQQINGVTVTPSKGSTVGVGQPVSLAFDHPVRNKAAVERHVTISTSPKTEGSWGWTKDPLTGIERVDWRPKTYWHKGTKVTLQARLSGVNTGDSRYLRRDGEGRGYFGRTNMSHGCVDMSLADGKWLYNRAAQGDLVQITGSTRATVSPGNGFGDWNLPYAS